MHLIPFKNIRQALIPTFHARIDKKFYALSRRVLLRVTSAFREYRSTLCQSATGIAIMHSLRWMINRANLDKFYCDRQAFLLTCGRATTRRIITFNDCPMATLLFASFLLSPSWVSRHRGDTNLIASNENLMPAEIPAARFSVPNGLGIHPWWHRRKIVQFMKNVRHALLTGCTVLIVIKSNKINLKYKYLSSLTYLKYIHENISTFHWIYHFVLCY